MSILFSNEKLTLSTSVPDDASVTVCGWATQETLHSGGNSQVLAALQLAGTGLFLGDDGTTTNLVLVQDGGATLNVGPAFAVGREFFWAFTSNGVGAGNTHVYCMPRGSNSLTVTNSAGARTAGAPTSLDIGSDGFAHPWKGRIWDVMAWSRLLTTSELLKQAFRCRPIIPDVYCWLPLERADLLRDYGPSRRDPAVTGTPVTAHERNIYRKPRRVTFLPATGAMSGTATWTWSPSATLRGSGALSGSASWIWSPTGNLTDSTPLSGAMSGSTTWTWAASASLAGSGTLSGSAAWTWTPSATLGGAGALSGATSWVWSPTGTLRGAGALSGTASWQWGQAGSLTGSGALAGSSTWVWTPSGTLINLTPTGEISGASSWTWTASATLTNVSAATEVQPTGGYAFYHAFDLHRARRLRRKQEEKERQEEADEIQAELDREIAKELRKQEAIDAERADLARIQELADKYAGTRQKVPRTIAATLLKAQEERSRNSLKQLQREMTRLMEQEEIEALMILLNQ